MEKLSPREFFMYQGSPHFLRSATSLVGKRRSWSDAGAEAPASLATVQLREQIAPHTNHGARMHYFAAAHPEDGSVPESTDCAIFATRLLPHLTSADKTVRPTRSVFSNRFIEYFVADVDLPVPRLTLHRM